MKTNEWLSYFLEQHQAEVNERLAGEIKGHGLTPPADTVAELVQAVAADFDAEAFSATPAALQRLAAGLAAQDAARAAAVLGKVWQKAEHLLGGYIAEEPDLSGGARRLAYLRLSEFGANVRGVAVG
ncbi:MAG: hypothetical protein M3Z04_05125 [Chloroflexota bacterium]|nr:hypothetical protein [Chloroflexota bacterium]